MSTGQFFTNENEVNGLKADAAQQIGRNRFDDGGFAPEKSFTLPWVLDKHATWQYYECWIECYLDSGIVVHRVLPQSDYAADSLGTVDVYDGAMDVNIAGGVNTKSNGQFTDTVQRMANSRYFFALKGKAIRVGYQVPIPKVVGTLAGVTAIPVPMDQRPEQFAYNKVVANYSGIPVFLAEWELWYTLASSPSAPVVPPSNLAAHIRADVTLPEGIQVPVTAPDPNAVQLNLETMVQNERK